MQRTRATLLGVLAAVLWAVVAGVVARAVLGGDKPGPVLTIAAGFGGCLLGFLVAHELLRIHEFHLFKPESLIPAATASAMILLAVRRVTRASQRTWLFR